MRLLLRGEPPAYHGVNNLMVEFNALPSIFFGPSPGCLSTITIPYPSIAAQNSFDFSEPENPLHWTGRNSAAARFQRIPNLTLAGRVPNQNLVGHRRKRHFRLPVVIHQRYEFPSQDLSSSHHTGSPKPRCPLEHSLLASKTFQDLVSGGKRERRAIRVRTLRDASLHSPK